MSSCLPRLPDRSLIVYLFNNSPKTLRIRTVLLILESVRMGFGVNGGKSNNGNDGGGSIVTNDKEEKDSKIGKGLKV